MTEPDVVVRVARAEDRDGYIAVFEAVAAERRWIATEPPVDHERVDRAIAEALERDDRLRMVADVDGTVVGMLGAEENAGIVSFGMAVAAAWRGRGVGSRLLEACLAWARERGAHKVTLQVWPHNSEAIGLYERYGFEVEGRLRAHYRRQGGELWDALLMGLELRARS